MALVWWLLYAFIGDYEESRPANVMNEVVEQLENGDVAGVLANALIESNEFETDTERLTAYLGSLVNGHALRYSKKSGEYAENHPIYLLYADNTPIAKFTLSATGENSFGFTLWRLGRIYVGSDLSGKTVESYTITVPKGSTVAINGVVLEDKYITEDNIEFEPCKNIGSYVAKPLKTTYEVSGLMMEPQVSVTYDGKTLETTKDGGAYSAEYPADDELFASMEASIKALDHAYGEYIINKGALSAVTSNMIGNAADYMSDIPAVWAFLYGKEYTYEFRNEEISEFTKYSDDCFSCHIYYDLYVEWNTGNVTYDTSLTYTYVFYENRWVVADFTIG
jgi:hypothetical protein